MFGSKIGQKGLLATTQKQYCAVAGLKIRYLCGTVYCRGQYMPHLSQAVFGCYARAVKQFDLHHDLLALVLNGNMKLYLFFPTNKPEFFPP